MRAERVLISGATNKRPSWWGKRSGGRVYRTECRKLQISLSDRLPFISLTCSLSHSELDISSPEQNKGPRFDFFPPLSFFFSAVKE